MNDDVGAGTAAEASSASAAPQVLTRLTAAARARWAAENTACAERLSACYQLFRECVRRENSGAGQECPPGHAVVDAFDVATGYVVAAMAISTLRAESMISFAVDLHERYPAILSALAAGRMDHRAAQLLAAQMATVHDDVIALVQQEVVEEYLAALENGERLGARAVRANVDAVIARYDADGIRRRRDEASRTRGVRITKGVDGMSTMSAILAADEASVLAEAIDQRVAEHADSEAEAEAEAAARATAGDARGETTTDPKYHYTKAERRADALMSLACGDSLLTDAAGQPPAPLRPKVTVIAPGDGVEGESARVKFTRTGQSALQALMDMLATADGASVEMVDPRIGAADDASRASTYRPGAELARRIRLRDGTCRHPGCAVPADDCDVDHVRPFDHADPARGGPTAERNLMCLCRRHHRFKTFSDWIYSLQPDGSLTVTAPDGSTMVTRPSGPLGAYRSETARAETRAWDRQQHRNPDPTTTGDGPCSEPTYWTRRASRLNAERCRTESVRPTADSRWWQRNAPVTSTVEREVQELLEEILDPPPF